MRTKLYGLILTIIVLTSCEYNLKYKNELSPYVHFLREDHKSAKDYIIDLFKGSDIVILSERDHREITQYDLILEIISDKYFIENVGNIYVEVGMRNLNPEINEFIHSNDISNEELEKKLIYFQQKSSSSPIWSYYNYNYFLKNLYLINQKLPKVDKINIYPTDVAFNWNNADSTKYSNFIYKKVANRDSLMAEFINNKISKSEKSKKSLIIMNFRHAFNDNFKKPDGSDFKNVGNYLFQKHNNKVANVLINTLIDNNDSDIETKNSAFQKGKWDASMKFLNIDNIGFNFKNSPFGNDHFDYWSFFNHEYRYENIYTGFVYYKEPENFKLVTGVPNIVDSTFIIKYKKRRIIYDKAWKRKQKEYTDSQIFEMNTKKEFNYDDIDYVKKEIEFWLK